MGHYSECFTYLDSFNSHHNFIADAISPILQMQKLNHKENK